jgi:hypothetical protein
VDLDYAKDVSIDHNNLDIELLHIAERVLAYGMELSEARFFTDQAKEKLDIEYAKAFQRALASVQKPVDAVKAAADTDPDHNQAQHDLNEAKFRQSLVQVAFDAMMVKMSALKALVNLLEHQYCNGPSEPKPFGQRITAREFATESLKNRATEAAKSAAERTRIRHSSRKDQDNDS